MLETFTVDTFSPHEGETFTMRVGAAELELRLDEVSPLGKSGGGSPLRRPFSLIFVGPASPVYEQRIYGLRHPGMGEFELFLVPIGPSREGMRYQAIFT